MSYKTYTILLAIAAIIAVAFSALVTPPPPWAGVIVLVALAAVAEWLAFQLPVLGSVSLSFVAINSAGLLYGPLVAGLVGAAAGAVPSGATARRDPLRTLFNIAQLALSGVLGGWAYRLLGGVGLIAPTSDSLQFPSALLPLAAAASALFLSNASLVAVGVSLALGIPMLEVWRQSIASFLRSFVILALFGFVMAQVVATAGTIGLLLLLVPFVATRQTFQVYSKLKEAYSETVRSLVNAVDAKDVYTRGHSERVAVYSRAIAEEMGMSPSSTARVEIAALLHDIGKLGVRKSVLSKPGRLSSDEFEEVRSHPVQGRVLLDEVSFLSDVVPLIYSHHERIDGTGYPEGLTGAQISIEARLLTVADAYDAMTSERPYRPPLDRDIALAELRAGAGTQFDAAAVAALQAALENGACAVVDGRMSEQ